MTTFARILATAMSIGAASPAMAATIFYNAQIDLDATTNIDSLGNLNVPLPGAPFAFNPGMF